MSIERLLYMQARNSGRTQNLIKLTLERDGILVCQNAEQAKTLARQHLGLKTISKNCIERLMGTHHDIFIDHYVYEEEIRGNYQTIRELMEKLQKKNKGKKK